MTDNTELKRLAEAAPGGPWVSENDSLYFKDGGYTRHLLDADAGHDVEDEAYYAALKFIAAANPATVLALIAENEQLAKTAGGWDRLNIQNKALSDSFRAERDQLRAEVAGLRTGYEAYEQVVQGLKAEVERHRAYADKCESAAAGFSRQLQAALIEIKALQGEKAAQGAIRKERQAEGIEKARAEGKYQGRPIDADLHARVIGLLQSGHGVRPTARLAECSTTTVIRIKAAMSKAVQP